jgi:membrane-associated phospholipid phosphatase
VHGDILRAWGKPARHKVALVTAEVEDEAAASPGDVSPWRLAGLRARQRRRRLLLGVVVVFTSITAVFGVPTGREWLTFWMLLTLFAACGGEFGVWRRAVVRDWLPLLAVLFAYDLLRGVANEVGGRIFGLPRLASNPSNAVSSVQAHLFPPIDGDKLLFGGKVPTLWLQDHFYDPGVAHWWDRVAVSIYLSHFLVSLVLAIVLWCVNYPLFRRYIAALVSLTVITLMTYVLFPAAPPWMAGLNNAFGKGVTVDRVVQQTLHVLGGSTVDSAVEKGQAYSNAVAAMPSLHAAIPMLLLAFFWPEVRRRGKVGLSLYAGGMALTLVYSGEHYVTDVLVGWLYAIAVVVVLRRLSARRALPESAPVENPLTTR